MGWDGLCHSGGCVGTVGASEEDPGAAGERLCSVLAYALQRPHITATSTMGHSQVVPWVERGGSDMFKRKAATNKVCVCVCVCMCSGAGVWSNSILVPGREGV